MRVGLISVLLALSVTFGSGLPPPYLQRPSNSAEIAGTAFNVQLEGLVNGGPSRTTLLESASPGNKVTASTQSGGGADQSDDAPAHVQEKRATTPKCTTGTQFLQNNKCVACTTVDKSAKTCSSMGVVTACKSNYLSAGKCVTAASCPSGTYANLLRHACMKCSSYFTGASKCTTKAATACSSPYFLSGTACKKTCPSGTFGKVYGRTCAKCSVTYSGSLTCNATAALTCSSGLTLTKGKCISIPVCVTGRFLNTATNKCDACFTRFPYSTSCTADEPLVCRSPRVLLKGVCAVKPTTTSTTTTRTTTTTSLTTLASRPVATTTTVATTSSYSSSTSALPTLTPSSTSLALSATTTPSTSSASSSSSDSASSTAASVSSSTISASRLPVATLPLPSEDSLNITLSISLSITDSPSATATTTTAAATPTCPSPPATFDGTTSGFSTLCSVRYCDAAPAKDVTWSGSSGSVTRVEIETALGLLGKTEPVLSNGLGNILANGVFGQAIYNAGQLFEITGDRRALDLALQLAENILSLRNDPVTGVVMWTGNREQIWPPRLNDPTYLPGGGCEQGTIVANMVTPAVYILKTPCLWDLIPSRVAGWTGPTPFSANDTYKTRALALLAAGDQVYADYFIPRWFDSKRKIIQPNDQRYLLVGDLGKGNLPGMPMAWNRRGMILDGFLRLAAAHETPGALDSTLRNRYDLYTQYNIKAFLSDLTETVSSNGMPTYDWDYMEFANNTEEVKGIHALWDIYTVHECWQRNPTLFGLTDEVMTRFANTMLYTVYQGNNTFSGYIDGISTIATPSVVGLWGQWSVYGRWLPEWYEVLVAANTKVGFNRRPWLSVPLLWTKNALSDSAPYRWSGGFATGNTAQRV